MLTGRRCSSDLFPLDVFPVNRNCRALSAPGARASVSPAAFGSLVFCWENKPFSFLLMVSSLPALQILALEIHQNQTLAPCGALSGPLWPLESFYDL